MPISGILSGVFTALETIVNAVIQVIDWLWTHTPGPAKAFIFLFMISNLLFIVPSFMNMVGYHCDSQQNLYKIPITGFVANLKYLKNAQELKTEVEDVGGTIYADFKTALGQRLCEPPNRLATCVNCTEIIVNGTTTCNSTGYRLDESGGAYLSTDWINCQLLGCAPPEGYFYNLTEDRFQCYTDCKTVNETEDLFDDELLTSSVASRLNGPSEDEKFSADNIVGVGCKPLEPGLFMFSEVNVFDKTIWQLIIILMTIIWIGAKFIG